MGVLESDCVDGVVALSSNRANAQTVATRAIDVVNHNLGATGDRNAVILVVDNDVLQGDVVTTRDVEAIGVVGSWIITTGRVGLIAIGVIKSEAGNSQMLHAADVEAVDRPVLDIEVGNLGVVELLEDDEMVGPERCELSNMVQG